MQQLSKEMNNISKDSNIESWIKSGLPSLNKSWLRSFLSHYHFPIPSFGFNYNSCQDCNRLMIGSTILVGPNTLRLWGYSESKSGCEFEIMSLSLQWTKPKSLRLEHCKNHWVFKIQILLLQPVCQMCLEALRMGVLALTSMGPGFHCLLSSSTLALKPPC